MRWSGEFSFGQSWVAFRGRCGDNAFHRHATAQISVGLDGPVTIRQADNSVVTGNALFVRPGVSHQLEAHGAALLILVEPQAFVGRRLMSETEPQNVSRLPAELQRLIQTDGALSACIAALDDDEAFKLPMDVRLGEALTFIETSNGARIIERAANEVNLSVSRLRALAQRHLGISLAKWMMLRKLRCAAEALASGCTLAEAAIDAGFSDQAHLSRSMRQVFGVTPLSAAGAIGTEQAKHSISSE
ncbi:helix-turn-helix transcriptional regulator [Aliidiomarina soli]|uniref:HTH araC/xylS-type domain-containing protein n=1 Tax=Aliidiomarina soli TaxID=1928574 RepID=A0A432WM52_9GAMM|nr:AraC family transcriptional regulator [Aliidiomarina soli]RUO34838.1 hypothetical protein CWE14_02240 [Aliidiomarina soli]